MAIIDFRLRPPLKGFLDSRIYSAPDNRRRYTQKLGWGSVASADAQSADLLFDEMDRAGITLGVAVGRATATLGTIANADVAAIVADHPDRFVGVGSTHVIPRSVARTTVDEVIELGLGAVNLEPGVGSTPMRADDRRLYPIYAQCEDAGLPVIVMAGGGAGPDITYTAPEALDRVLGDFPDLQLVCSHGGWPWVGEILSVAFRRENFYLCPDMYLRGLPGSEDYIAAANGFLSERFLFGTAYPFCPLEPYVEWFKSLPLSDTSRERVMYGNAARLLKLAS